MLRLRLGSSGVSAIVVLQVLVGPFSVSLPDSRVVELSCKSRFDVEISVLFCCFFVSVFGVLCCSVAVRTSSGGKRASCSTVCSCGATLLTLILFPFRTHRCFEFSRESDCSFVPSSWYHTAASCYRREAH